MIFKDASNKYSPSLKGFLDTGDGYIGIKLYYIQELRERQSRKKEVYTVGSGKYSMALSVSRYIYQDGRAIEINSDSIILKSGLILRSLGDLWEAESRLQKEDVLSLAGK